MTGVPRQDSERSERRSYRPPWSILVSSWCPVLDGVRASNRDVQHWDGFQEKRRLLESFCWEESYETSPRGRKQNKQLDVKIFSMADSISIFQVCQRARLHNQNATFFLIAAIHMHIILPRTLASRRKSAWLHGCVVMAVLRSLTISAAQVKHLWTDDLLEHTVLRGSWWCGTAEKAALLLNCLRCSLEMHFIWTITVHIPKCAGMKILSCMLHPFSSVVMQYV